VAVERYEPGLEARALAMIARAIEIDPDLAVAHFDAAVLLERSGEDRRALSHWARYLRLAGGSEDTALARDRLGR
jgi:tetratricopeptide (TPR) repeat protein